MSKIDVDFREQEDVKYELTYARDGVTMSVFSKKGDKVNIHLSRKQFDELNSVFNFQLPKEQMPDDTLLAWKHLCGIKDAKEVLQAAKIQKLEELKLQVMAQNPQLLGELSPQR